VVAIAFSLTSDNALKVNAASIAGLIGFEGMTPYVASKHAVVGLTKTAAKDNPHVRLNCVAPGMSPNLFKDAEN
jgi:NAD(P)-dependent dehydrogenase (short-subunit alcohol dehydrogenase family)